MDGDRKHDDSVHKLFGRPAKVQSAGVFNVVSTRVLQRLVVNSSWHLGTVRQALRTQHRNKITINCITPIITTQKQNNNQLYNSYNHNTETK